MALCEKILLAGFSGSGKSTLIRALRANPPEGWTEFDDLDQLVFRRHGKGAKDLADLIASSGWDKFRLWERQELDGWLKDEGKGVLALGAGAFTPMVWQMYGPSRKIKFCYLKTPFEICWQRLMKTDEVRPLAQKGIEQLNQVYLERKPVYENIEWVISNDEKTTIKDLVEAFKGKLE